MKKPLTISIIALTVILIGVVGLVLRNNSNSSDTNTTNRPNIAGNHSDMNQTQEGVQSASRNMNVTETNKVDIKDFEFTPSNIRVKKGTTVTWTNQDSIRHDILPDEESSAFQGSELLSQDESYSWTFDTVGTYTYICSPHPYMKGTVEVVE